LRKITITYLHENAIFDLRSLQRAQSTQWQLKRNHQLLYDLHRLSWR
jgi:hypothetical protein